MAYKYYLPKTVISPRKNVSDIKVIHDGGNVHGAYSVARLKWNNRDVIGIRWNISENEAYDPAKKAGKTICKGEPISRGYPTWFILPIGFLTAMKGKNDFNKKIDEFLEELS